MSTDRMMVAPRGARWALALLVAGATVLATSAGARAWDIEVYIDRLDDAFLVTSFTNSAPTWTTVSEGLQSDKGVGSIPNNPITQAWSGADWPSAVMHDDVTDATVSTESDIEHYNGVTDEFWDYAQAYVYGDLPAGMAYGSAVFYDFTLEVPAFSKATVALDPSFGFNSVYIESEVGDDGFAFAGAKLYDPTLGVNDPGGVNSPLADDTRFLSSPPTGAVIDDQLFLSHEFDNLNGSTSQLWNLRLEARALVFENDIPEPATLGVLGIGALALLRRRRTA